MTQLAVKTIANQASVAVDNFGRSHDKWRSKRFRVASTSALPRIRAGRIDVDTRSKTVADESTYVLYRLVSTRWHRISPRIQYRG